MPAVTDVLTTVLDLRGGAQYVAGMDKASDATKRLSQATDLIKSGARLAGDVFRKFGGFAMEAGQEAATFQTAAGNFKGMAVPAGAKWPPPKPPKPDRPPKQGG